MHLRVRSDLALGEDVILLVDYSILSLWLSPDSLELLLGLNAIQNGRVFLTRWGSVSYVLSIRNLRIRVIYLDREVGKVFH